MNAHAANESTQEQAQRVLRTKKAAAHVLYCRRTKQEPKAAYLAFLTYVFHKHEVCKQVLLTFGSSWLIRKLVRQKADACEPSWEEPNGSYIRLFRRPSPSEGQIRIAYENAAEHYRLYLLEQHGWPTLHILDTQLLIYLPEDDTLDEKLLWQTFQRDVLFSTKHLTRSLLPLLNLSKLSARGFSVPEVLLLSPGMKRFMAAWFYRVILLVENRLSQRQIKLTRHLEGTQSLTDGEFKKTQEMQDKEKSKYSTHFQKRLQTLQKEHDKHVAKIQKVEDDLKKLKKPSGKRYEKLIAQRSELHASIPFPTDTLERIKRYAEEHNFDLFQCIRAEVNAHPEIYTSIIQLSQHFKRTAADQINHPRGDIFNALVGEWLRLANTPDEACTVQIPPLFSETPVVYASRTPGDNPKDACFACGNRIEKGEHVFETRRMVFTSPEQRLQGGANPSKPRCCVACVAYSYVCGVKPTDDTTLIRLTPRSGSDEFSLSETVQQFIRTLISKDLHVQAGSYIALGCKDFIEGGKPASSSIGSLAYAYYTLAHETHPAALEHMNVRSLQKGSEIPLSNAALLWLHALLKASELKLVERSKLSRAISQAIRYVMANRYIEAEYTLASHLVEYKTSTFQRDLEPYRTPLIQALKQEHAMHISEEIESIMGMTGLLGAFVAEIGRKTEKTSETTYYSDEQKREMAKLIESCMDPIVWINRFASHKSIDFKNVRLYKKSENAYIYEHAKKLLEHLEHVDIKTRENNKDNNVYLTIHSEDIPAAYAYVLKGKSTYAQKEWSHKLKLALYSQFPSVLSRYKKTKSN